MVLVWTLVASPHAPNDVLWSPECEPFVGLDLEINLRAGLETVEAVR